MPPSHFMSRNLSVGSETHVHKTSMQMSPAGDIFIKNTSLGGKECVSNQQEGIERVLYVPENSTTEK